MKKLSVILSCLCLVLPTWAADVLVNVHDIASGSTPGRSVTITLTKPTGPVVAGPWIVAGDSKTQITGPDGTTTFKNLLMLGQYRLDISGNPPRSFPFSVSVTNGTYNVIQLMGTNAAVEMFYDTAQIDALLAASTGAGKVSIAGDMMTGPLTNNSGYYHTRQGGGLLAPYGNLTAGWTIYGYDPLTNNFVSLLNIYDGALGPTNGQANFAGTVTAYRFAGDGSGLTNLSGVAGGVSLPIYSQDTSGNWVQFNGHAFIDTNVTFRSQAVPVLSIVGGSSGSRGAQVIGEVTIDKLQNSTSPLLALNNTTPPFGVSSPCLTIATNGATVLWVDVDGILNGNGFGLTNIPLSAIYPPDLSQIVQFYGPANGQINATVFNGLGAGLTGIPGSGLNDNSVTSAKLDPTFLSSLVTNTESSVSLTDLTAYDSLRINGTLFLSNNIGTSQPTWSILPGATVAYLHETGADGVQVQNFKFWTNGDLTIYGSYIGSGAGLTSIPGTSLGLSQGSNIVLYTSGSNIVINSSAAGGQNQTPVTQDINYGTFSATNMNTLLALRGTFNDGTAASGNVEFDDTNNVALAGFDGTQYWGNGGGLTNLNAANLVGVAGSVWGFSNTPPTFTPPTGVALCINTNTGTLSTFYNGSWH